MRIAVAVDSKNYYIGQSRSGSMSFWYKGEIFPPQIFFFEKSYVFKITTVIFNIAAVILKIMIAKLQYF